ncbi:MAG: hypothetical protein OXK82_05285 [Deltaproteobacteria bacterium]|nr:hypothetical protein [Deltaproteobacteria bacterium]
MKEYAAVVTALVTVIAALGALGLWAINAQVTPEIKRLEARIDVHETLLRQIDRKLDASIRQGNERFTRSEAAMNERFARFEKGMEDRFARFEKRVNERLESFERTVNAKFETIDERFERIEGEITTIRSDIKAILLRLPRKADTG